MYVFSTQEIGLPVPLPAVIAVRICAPEVHRFGEEHAIMVEIGARAPLGHEQRIVVHAEQRLHHLEVAAREQRPVDQACVLEPVRAAPAAIVGVEPGARLPPRPREYGAVELDRERAASGTRRDETLQRVAAG